MAITRLTGIQLADGSVQRQDLDTTTAGSAVIRRALAGNGVTLASTGVDAGTGDVTISSGIVVNDAAPGSPLNGLEWWDGVTGIKYTRIDDGAGAHQWVELGPGGAGPAGAAGAAGAGVPVGGTVGQVLEKIDATNYNTQWVTRATGAAGSNMQVQLNASGALAGSAGLTFNSATNELALLGTNTGIILAAVTAEPSAPAADRLEFYAKNVGGKMLPKFIGPSGVDSALQAHIAFNNVSLISPAATTVINVIGCAVTSVGTVSHPALASTNYKTQARRFAIVSVATAGGLSSLRVNALEFWRGSAAGLGGFYIVTRFSLDTLAAGNRAFVGISDAATTAPTNVDPTTSVTIGKVGMAINANTGNWSLVNNVAGTAPNILALGANFPVDTTTLYELILFSAPNGSGISYRCTNLTTNTGTLSGSLTTNIPASTTFLGRQAWMTNNATASAIQFSMSRFYLESDT